MLFAQASSLHSLFSHPSLIVLFPSHSLLLRTLHLERDLVVYFTWIRFHSCPLVVQLLSRVRLCDPIGCSMPGFFVLHLAEFKTIYLSFIDEKLHDKWL